MKRNILFILLCFFYTYVFAQTSPVSRGIPFVENFGSGFITGNFPVPNSIVTYEGNADSYQTSVDDLTFSNMTFYDVFVQDVISVDGFNVPTTISGGNGPYCYIKNNDASLLFSLSDKTYAAAFTADATGKTQIRISYKILLTELNTTAVGNCFLQYRTGGSGDWASLPGSAYSSYGRSVGDSVNFSCIELPSTVDGVSMLEFRWLTYQSDAINVLNGDVLSFAIDNIKITSAPAQPVVYNPNDSVCGSGTVRFLLNNTATGLSFNWYDSNSILITSDSTDFTTPLLTSSGTYFVETSNDTCSSPRVTLNAVVSTIPSTPALINTLVTICGPGSVDFQVIPVATQYNWYANSIGGSSLLNGTLYSTTISGIKETIWVEAYSNGCFSDRVSATGIAYTIPGVPVLDAPLQTICGSGTLSYNVTNPSAHTNWYTVSTGGVSLADNAGYILTIGGSSATLWVEANSGYCNSGRTTATGTRFNIPATPILDASIKTICGPGSLTFTVTNLAVHHLWYTTSVGGVSLADNSSYTLTSSGIVWVERASSRCTSSTRTMATAIFYTIPGVPVINAPFQTICGSGTLSYNVTNPSAHTNWYSVSTGGVFLADNASYTMTLSGTSNTLWIESGSGYCTSGRVTATGISYTIPLVPVIDSPLQTICGSGTLSYNVTNPSVHTNWYTVSTGGVSLADNAGYILTIGGSSATLWVEANSGYCNSGRTTATGTRFNIPATPILDATIKTICGPGSLTFTVTNLAVHHLWYTTSVGGVSLTDNSSYTLTTSGIVWVERASSFCTSSTRTMATAIFYTVPGVPVIDSPLQTICGTGTLSYNVTNPSAHTNWYSVSTGGVSLADNASYTMTLSGASNTLWIESGSGYCTSGRVTASGISYTIPSIPVIDSPLQTICGTGTLSYNVTNPSAHTNWYSVSTGGVSLADNASYTMTLSGASNTLWIESGSGYCTSGRVTATGISYTIPSIPVIDFPLQTICGAGTLSYNVTNPSVHTNWYSVSTGGVSLADNAGYTMTLSGASNTLWIESGSGYCTSGRVTASGILYTIPSIPVIDAPLQTICGAGTLSYNVTNPSAHTNWYSVSTGGVSLADNAGYTMTLSGASNTLWIESGSGYCTSGRVTASGISYTIPSIPVIDAPLQTICGTGTLSYNVTNPSAHTNWYSVSIGGVSLADNAGYTITLSGASNTLWIESGSGYCTSGRVTASGISYTIPSIPVIDSPLQTICGAGTLSYNVTNPSVHTNWYSVSTGGVSLADNAGYTITLSGASNTLWIESGSSYCTSGRVTASGISYTIPSIPVIDSPLQTICGAGTLSYNVTNPSVHTNWYSVSIGGVSLADNAGYTITLSGASNTLWIESGSGYCTSGRVTASGISYTIPSIPVIDSPLQTICGAGTLSYNVTNPSAHTNWYSVSTGGVSLADNASYTITLSGASNTLWIESGSGYCTSGRVTASGISYTIPSIPVIDSPLQTICGVGTLSYNVTNPSAHTNWYSVSTGGVSLADNAGYTMTLSGASNTLWIESGSGYCTSGRVTASGISYTIPGLPVLDANIKTVCGSILSYNVTNNTEPHYYWYATSVGGISLTDNSSYTTPAQSNTQYSVWVAANSGYCTSVSRTKATGNYYNTPAPPVFDTQVASVCGNNTLSFAVTNVTEPHYLWYSASIGGVSLKDSIRYTTVSTSRVTLWVESFDNTCPSERVSVSGISYYVPSVPVLDASVKSICGTQTLTFSVTGNSEAHYYWYATSTGGTSLADSSSYITPAQSNIQYSVWVEANSGYCTSVSRTKATGNYFNRPAPPVFDTHVESVCGNNTLSFSVINNTEPHYLWYLASIGGISLKDSIRYTTVSASRVTVWVESFDNTCPSERVSVSGISYYVPLAPVLDAGVKSICGTQTLTFSVPGNSEAHYYWYATSTGGASLADSSSYTTPAQSNTQYSVWVEANSGYCTSASRTKATGNYYSIPASPQLDASVKSICGSGTLTFSVTNATLPYYLWYTVSTGGTALTDSTSYTTPVKSNTQYNVWVEANSIHCPSVRTMATGDFYHIPVVPVLDAGVKSICGNNVLSFSVAALEPHYYWYNVSVGGSPLVDNTTYTTPSLYDTEYEIWVEANSNHCTGSRSKAKGVYYYVPAAPVLDADIKSICGNNTLSFSVTPIEPHYYWYTVSSGGSSLVDNTMYTTPALYDTEYEVWVEANSNHCTGSRSKAKGIYYYVPAAPVLDASVKSICGNNTLSFSVTATEPHYYWYDVSIGGSLLTDNPVYTSPSFYDTEYDIWVEANSDHCTGSRTMAKGIYYAIPPVPVVSNQVDSLCGPGSITFKITSLAGLNYYWYTLSVAGDLQADAASYTTPYNTTSQSYWVQSDDGYCSSDRINTFAKIKQLPDPTIILTDDTLLRATVQEVSYQWAEGTHNNTIPGANANSLAINYSGGYFVNLKGANGCTITGAYDYIKPGGDDIYFEDFQKGMPGDFTLLNLDNADVVDVAGFADIYNTHPWAVVSATNDPTSTFFGGINNKVASATSIFKDKKIDANRWMITDTITLDHEGISHYDLIHNTAISIQWQAISDDGDEYLDGYNVLISTTTKDPSAFTPLFTILKEPNKAQNHKIDSVSVTYNGKKVFLAFQLNTPRNKGDRLMIDNILVKSTTKKITLNEATATINERNDVSAIIAPNPASESAILRYSIAYPSEIKISIFDLLGNLLLSHNAGYTIPGENRYEVNLSDFNKGFYLVRIDSDTGGKILKLVVEK